MSGFMVLLLQQIVDGKRDEVSRCHSSGMSRFNDERKSALRGAFLMQNLRAFCRR